MDRLVKSELLDDSAEIIEPETITLEMYTEETVTEPEDDGSHGNLGHGIDDVMYVQEVSTHDVNDEVIHDIHVTKDSEQDEQKDDIYDHPLFDLMCLLFEKCEHATLTADCPSPDSFDKDIDKFIQSNDVFLSNNIDLDILIVKAIQVLRIHLLELDKVSELCKDFCTRYISCLKAKLQSENLLRVEGCDLDFDPDMTSPVSSPPLPPEPQSSVLLHSPPPPPAAATPATSQIITAGSTMYQMVQTAQGIVARPIQIQTAPTTPSTPSLVTAQAVSLLNTNPSSVSLLTTTTDDLPHIVHHHHSKNGKRGVLPKSATQIMKSWLFQNIVHPYPTEDQKRQLALQTNLTLLQVNNWFINARRRILQPMLDGATPGGTPGDKTKKPRPSGGTKTNRHWPRSISTESPKFEPRFEYHMEGEEGVVETVEMTIGGEDDENQLLVEAMTEENILAMSALNMPLIVPTPPRSFIVTTNDDT